VYTISPVSRAVRLEAYKQEIICHTYYDDVIVYFKVLPDDFHGENEENIGMVTFRADILMQDL
jgi:hypothetical protein